MNSPRFMWGEPYSSMLEPACASFYLKDQPADRSKLATELLPLGRTPTGDEDEEGRTRMDSLAGLYHITPENLALRRRFIGLDADVIALLGSLRPWADGGGR